MNGEELQEILEHFGLNSVTYEKPEQITNPCVMCPPRKKRQGDFKGLPTNEPLCREHYIINEHIINQRV